MLERGWIWDSICGKRRYFTETTVERARNAVEFAISLRIWIYPCPDGGFHLTRRQLWVD